MTEVFRATVVGSAALALALGWLSWRCSRLDPRAPDRLVMEMRLAQFAALLLVMTSGVYFGLAVAHEDTARAGLDIAIAVGFFVLAGLAITWEPTASLTGLTLAWTGHALVDLAHGVDLLPTAIVPSWFVTGCAIYDVCIAGLCYLPLLRRER